jgi:hypothetical protein
MVERRRKVMERWAAYLDGASTNVVAFKRA